MLVSGNDTWKYGSHLCNLAGNVILRTKLTWRMAGGRDGKNKIGSWKWTDQLWRWAISGLLFELLKSFKSGYFLTGSHKHHYWYARERKKDTHSFWSLGWQAKHQACLSLKRTPVLLCFIWVVLLYFIFYALSYMHPVLLISEVPLFLISIERI